MRTIYYSTRRTLVSICETPPVFFARVCWHTRHLTSIEALLYMFCSLLHFAHLTFKNLPVITTTRLFQYLELLRPLSCPFLVFLAACLAFEPKHDLVRCFCAEFNSVLYFRVWRASVSVVEVGCFSPGSLLQGASRPSACCLCLLCRLQRVLPAGRAKSHHFFWDFYPYHQKLFELLYLSRIHL